MKKHLGKIMITLGLAVIIIAISTKLITSHKKSQLINEYIKYESMEKNKVNDNETNTEKQNTEEKNDDSVNENIIGIMRIPKIDLEVPIGEGTDNKTLKYSVGHFTDTAMPGDNGNFSVIGHRSYTFGEFFNRLDELEIGDAVKVEKDNTIFNYEIREKFVVEPEEVSVLNQTDYEEITLITCTPIRVATHRLIVKGMLVDVEEK